MNINTKYDYGQEVQVKPKAGKWLDVTVTGIHYGKEGLEYTLYSKDSGYSYFHRKEGREIRLKPILTEEELEKLDVYYSENSFGDLCEEAVRLYLAREVKQ
ncbi:MAG: hypothetical protein GY941_11165 [Planctomycetes bacterium]|nr:hypothetical protein [Planctomycetota bacterium]